MIPGLESGTHTVRATIKVGTFPMPLSPLLEPKMVRAVVDQHVHLPDMFELTFLDEEGSFVEDSGLKIGTPIEVYGGAPNSMEAKKLIAGEVTAVEAICADLHVYTVVRGYEKAHLLQRAKRTRTFVNKTDSDAVRTVASDAGLDIGTIDDTSTVHEHLSQVAQTDWDFIKQRAREVGFETGVVDGKFFFKRPPGMPAGGGGLGGMVAAAASAALDMLGLGDFKLTFKDNLISFYPRISAANLTTEVEVRVWDPKKGEAVTSKTDVRSDTASVPDKPADLADAFGGFSLPIPIPLPAIPGLPGFGPEPSAKAYVVVDRPLGSFSNASSAADEMAKGMAEHVASTFAEAEGYAVGHPDIKAGGQVTIEHVPKSFAGKWTVTNARHIFDESEGGYYTRFYVSGRQERSLFGLASGGASQGNPTRIPGLVCGVVTNNVDPDSLGRVKVALPWLSPQYESDWARVAYFGSGKNSGGFFTPETGDEVLVGFEFGDPRRPYVLGGLRNSNTKFDLGGGEVKSMGLAGMAVKRGYVSPAGNHLLFEDELMPPPAEGPPMNSKFALETKDGKMGVVVDQTGGKLTISCEPSPPASQTPTGTLEISVGPAGTINIKAGAGGTVTIDGGLNLELKAKASIKIASEGMVEVSGKMIKLN